MKNRIRDLREDHDLSQRKVAEAIGITQRKYSYVETGTQQLTDELIGHQKALGREAPAALAAFCPATLSHFFQRYLQRGKVAAINIMIFL